jgi:hypothetical protein
MLRMEGVWISGRTGVLDENGNVREILCVGNDITERSVQKRPEASGPDNRPDS